VVIGIIALLIGILLPVLSKARAAGNRTVCLSNIRQLGTGILMYCTNNNGWFPTCAYWDNGVSYIQSPDDWIYWQANRNIMDSAIAKYVARNDSDKFKNLLRCPADDFDGRKARAGITPGQGPYFYSYGMNHAMGTNGKPYPGYGRWKISQWRVPSRKILLVEPLEKYCTAAGWDYGTILTRRHGTGRLRADHPGNPEMRFGSPVGINVSAAFVDGHAEGIDTDFACVRFQTLAEAQ